MGRSYHFQCPSSGSKARAESRDCAMAVDGMAEVQEERMRGKNALTKKQPVDSLLAKVRRRDVVDGGCGQWGPPAEEGRQR